MHLLHELINWIVAMVSQFGYPGIVIMMFLESSFFPFPSEVVMVPAGYLAYQGKMSLVTAILMGILGSLLGGLFNYYIAVRLGRPFLEKWGKYMFITPEKLEKVEGFFLRHGEIGTFTGRLIPVIRQYISFPAGLARMKIPRFLFFTGLGSGLWCTILVVIGYVAGSNELLIKQHINTAIFGVIVLSAGVLAIYAFLCKYSGSKSIDDIGGAIGGFIIGFIVWAGFLTPFFIIGYQIYQWLKTGIWVEIPLYKLFHWVNIDLRVVANMEWQGFKKIIIWFLELPVWLMPFVLSLVLASCQNQIKPIRRSTVNLEP